MAGTLAIDRSRASPNHGERSGGAPDLLLLHYTGMRDEASAIDWLCNSASQVSCHYVVMEDGGLLQLVPDERRAWHAGRGSWEGDTDINSASIGVEIVNGGHDFGLPDYSDKQIDAVIALGLHLVHRYAIPPERILAHSDIAPARKRDPGERFPWQRLAEAGLGLFVESGNISSEQPLAPGDQGVAVAELQRDLGRYGYGLPISSAYDENTEIVVRAFQRHFRPTRVDGLADRETWSTLRQLLAAIGRRLATSETVVLAIDSAAADGRDVSWLWDVEYEQLAGRSVVATGPRAADLAVRLTYAGVEHRTVPDLAEALRGHPEPVDVVATYTPFQRLRKLGGL